ncbi:MAG TPA: hypothetical protein PLI09_08515 [Candidatus Hydrogenedentes bacterium]|nr:hypothetical protein [Candidatus Hydrogenedentota bacterium]
MISTVGLLIMSGMLLAAEPVSIGSRLELMIDDYLIEHMSGGATLRLHPPTPQEIVLVHDAPWEGNSCNYYSVFQDGDLYRMYYRGSGQTLKGEAADHEMTTCYAESRDGIHWTKPSLGLFEFNGSKDNNILWMGGSSHDFTPVKDTNPNCPPETKYKCVGAGDGGLLAFQSPDGIHWSPMNDGQPVITKGAFDSQNMAFWDETRKEYRVYFRDFRDGLRDIRTATSQDFIHWTDGQWLAYPGAPAEQLYTNQIIPYYRAPHIFLGFPTRYVDRGWTPSVEALPELEHRRMRAALSPREGSAVTDGLFMTSRDAAIFHRWDEVFIRPGLRTKDNWTYGDNYQNWGIVETKSAIDDGITELSVYATESYWTGRSCQLRRFTLRMDGFASLHAPRSGGEIITKPILFDGKDLVLNFSTSAAGSIKIEIQNPDGAPIDGFRLEDATDLFGDHLEHIVPWKDHRDLSALAGKPICLRIVFNDADLYALRFK